MHGQNHIKYIQLLKHSHPSFATLQRQDYFLFRPSVHIYSECDQTVVLLPILYSDVRLKAKNPLTRNSFEDGHCQRTVLSYLPMQMFYVTTGISRNAVSRTVTCTLVGMPEHRFFH